MFLGTGRRIARIGGRRGVLGRLLPVVLAGFRHLDSNPLD